MIDETINEDITYQTQPLDLRNQRTYAIKVGLIRVDSPITNFIQSGVNGLLDVARQTYKEANADAYQSVTDEGRKTRCLFIACYILNSKQTSTN